VSGRLGPALANFLIAREANRPRTDVWGYRIFLCSPLAVAMEDVDPAYVAWITLLPFINGPRHLKGNLPGLFRLFRNPQRKRNLI